MLARGRLVGEIDGHAFGQVAVKCGARQIPTVKHRRLSALRQASVSGVARTAEPCGASRMTVMRAPDTFATI